MSFALGPFVLSLDHLLFFLVFIGALLVGWLFGRGKGIKVEPVLTQMLFGGVVCARIAFVLMYLDDYLTKPISIIDIRDGGFLVWVGLVAAALIAAVHLWRKQGLRRPLGAAISIGAIIWVATTGAVRVMGIGQPDIPDAVLTTLDGGSQSLADFKSGPLVVNLWATWCGPCRREMPVLEQAQQREPGIQFVFLNQGESTKTVSQYLAKEELQLSNVLLDGRSEVSREMGVQGMPTTFFFDASGKLVDSHLGELSAATLRRSLKRISSD